MEHSGNAIALAVDHICSATGTGAACSNCGRGGSRARDRDRLEHSDRGRDRPESSGHVSASRHREIGHPQRNRTCTTFLPQERAAPSNLNMANGGDGTVQLNLRGLLPKETLVLVDGKRVAFGSLGAAGFSGAWTLT